MHFLDLTCACGRQLSVKEDCAGRKVKCPGCGTLLTVPLRPSPEAGSYALAHEAITEPAGAGPKEQRTKSQSAKRASRTQPGTVIGSQSVPPQLIGAGTLVFGVLALPVMLLVPDWLARTVILLALFLITGGICGVIAEQLGRPHRLVLCDDALQLVARGRRVVGHIPFDNVAEVHVHRKASPRQGEDTVSAVDIALIRRKRQDTWWPRLARSPDYDVRLWGEWGKTLRSIGAAIQDALERFREQTGQRR